MRLLAIEQTRSPQGKLRLRFDSGEAMLVLPAVVADLSLRPGMDIPDAARASLEAAAGSASAKERAVRHTIRLIRELDAEIEDIEAAIQSMEAFGPMIAQT